MRSINKLQKGQEEIKNKIASLGRKDQNKKPIWFDVINTMTSFTALSLGGKGKQDTLDRIADETQQEIV